MAYLSRVGWTATADTTQGGFPASNVLDSNVATAWMSASGYPHYLVIDLGAPQTFDALSYLPYGVSYGDIPSSVEVYVSTDGATWGAAIATATWPKVALTGRREFIMFARQTKQYIKLTGLAGYGATNYMGCAEFDLVIDPLNRSAWVATASSSYDATRTPAEAIDGYGDGNDSTYWLSAATFPHWLAVDMGSSQTIDYLIYQPKWIIGDPIYSNQIVPTLVRFYVSNLVAPDPTDLGDWTLAGEQYWPGDHRTHYVYSTDALGNQLDRVCRHFMLVGVHDDRYAGSTTLHRMACAEIYVGKLAVGDTYKVYYKCHPKQFYIFPENVDEGGETRYGAGTVDTLELQLAPADPTDLQLAKAVCETRLWNTSPLRTYYPEARFWDWDIPAGFPDTLPVETVSRVLEGAVVDASTLVPALYYKTSVHGVTTMVSGPDVENQILAVGAWSTVQWQTFWDTDSPPGEAIDNFITAHPYGHVYLWGSVNQTSPDHVIDVGRLNGVDIFYMVVWPATYAAPAVAAYLIVNKVLVPMADLGLFNLQIDGITQAADVGNGGTTGSLVVAAGAHTVGETAGTGTSLTDYTTVISGDADAAGNVVAIAGLTKTAIITNTRQGRITPGGQFCVLISRPSIVPDFEEKAEPLEP